MMMMTMTQADHLYGNSRTYIQTNKRSQILFLWCKWSKSVRSRNLLIALFLSPPLAFPHPPPSLTLYVSLFLTSCAFKARYLVLLFGGQGEISQKKHTICPSQNTPQSGTTKQIHAHSPFPPVLPTNTHTHTHTLSLSLSFPNFYTPISCLWSQCSFFKFVR